jgi:cobalt-zinc-cadmium efflux system outer membrane protein
VLALAIRPAVSAAASPGDPPSAHATTAPVLSIDDAVSSSLLLHPAVLEAQTALAQARGAAAQAAVLLSNPTASASLSLDGARSGGSLSQPISLTGEGVAARRTASAQMEAAEAQLARARRVAAADARAAYADAVVRCGQVTVAEDGVAIAVRLRDAVGLQHREGEASLLDLRLARLSLVQASARLLSAKEAEAEALRSLAALIGEPVAREALPADPTVAAPEPGLASQGERSDVRAAVAALRAAEANLTRQRAAGLAPVQVGAFVEVEDGRTFAGPSFSVQLPLFNRNQAQRSAADGAVAARAADHTRLVARAATERQTAEARFAEAGALEAALQTDPLAEARAALTSIEAGYRAGEIDLPSTVLLQDQVLDGEGAALALMGGIARARLDLLLATDDDRLLPSSSAPRSAP